MLVNHFMFFIKYKTNNLQMNIIPIPPPFPKSTIKPIQKPKYKNPFENESLLCIPNPNKIYYGTNYVVFKGITILMKWSLLTRRNNILHKRISDIVKNDPKLLNKTNALGWSALMMAARKSRADSTFETVKILIDAGADLDIQSSNGGKTALMYAIENCYSESSLDVAKMLVQAGADLTITDDIGNDVYAIAKSVDNNLPNIINTWITEELKK